MESETRRSLRVGRLKEIVLWMPLFVAPLFLWVENVGGETVTVEDMIFLEQRLRPSEAPLKWRAVYIETLEKEPLTEKEKQAHVEEWVTLQKDLGVIRTEEDVQEARKKAYEHATHANVFTRVFRVTRNGGDWRIDEKRLSQDTNMEEIRGQIRSRELEYDSSSLISEDGEDTFSGRINWRLRSSSYNKDKSQRLDKPAIEQLFGPPDEAESLRFAAFFDSSTRDWTKDVRAAASVFVEDDGWTKSKRRVTRDGVSMLEWKFRLNLQSGEYEYVLLTDSEESPRIYQSSLTDPGGVTRRIETREQFDERHDLPRSWTVVSTQRDRTAKLTREVEFFELDPEIEAGFFEFSPPIEFSINNMTGGKTVVERMPMINGKRLPRSQIRRPTVGGLRN